MQLDKKVIDFYNKSDEDSRLQLGLGPLEFERNKELISRFISNKNSHIADVGGGTGHYASWLSNLGHQVTLIDPVAKHISTAEKKAKKCKNPFKAIIGEAGKLPLQNNSFDVVILHGPLYHLQKESDRIQALKEAHRVCKTNGIVLGFAINYTASTLAALQSGMLHSPEVFNMCNKEVSTGLHNPPAKFPGMLGPAYFHKPEILKHEVEKAGFTIRGIFAVEGMGWLDKNFFEGWFSPKKKKNLLELIQKTESNIDILSISPHMMIAGQKE